MTDQAVPVNCDICGQPTESIGTRLCDPCWGCKEGINNLIIRNPDAAVKFLTIKLKEAELAVISVALFKESQEELESAEP